MLKPNDAEKLAKALFRLTVPTDKGNRIIRAVRYFNSVYVTDAYVCARLHCDDPYEADMIVDRVVELQGAYVTTHTSVSLTDKAPTKETLEKLFTVKASDRHDATLGIKLLEKLLAIAKCISPRVNLECHGNETPTAFYTFGDGLRLDAIQMPVRER